MLCLSSFFSFFNSIFLSLSTTFVRVEKEGLLHTTMPPVAPAGPGGARGPSTFDKCKLVRVVTCGLDTVDRSDASDASAIDFVTDSDGSENGSYDGRLYVLLLPLGLITSLTHSTAVGMIMGFIIGLFYIKVPEA